MAFWKSKPKKAQVLEPLPVPGSVSVPVPVSQIRVGSMAKVPYMAGIRVLALQDRILRCAGALAVLKHSGAEITACNSVDEVLAAFDGHGMFVMPLSEGRAELGRLISWIKHAVEEPVIVVLDEGGESPDRVFEDGADIVLDFRAGVPEWSRSLAGYLPRKAGIRPASDEVPGASGKAVGQMRTSLVRRASASFDSGLGLSVLSCRKLWLVVQDRAGSILGCSKGFSEALARGGRLFGRNYWEALPIESSAMDADGFAALLGEWRDQDLEGRSLRVVERFNTGNGLIELNWLVLPYRPEGEGIQGLVRMAEGPEREPSAESEDGKNPTPKPVLATETGALGHGVDAAEMWRSQLGDLSMLAAVMDDRYSGSAMRLHLDISRLAMEHCLADKFPGQPVSAAPFLDRLFERILLEKAARLRWIPGNGSIHLPCRDFLKLGILIEQALRVLGVELGDKVRVLVRELDGPKPGFSMESFSECELSIPESSLGLVGIFAAEINAGLDISQIETGQITIHMPGSVQNR